MLHKRRIAWRKETKMEEGMITYWLWMAWRFWERFKTGRDLA